jgi:hypothetical protein
MGARIGPDANASASSHSGDRRFVRQRARPGLMIAAMLCIALVCTTAAAARNTHRRPPSYRSVSLAALMHASEHTSPFDGRSLRYAWTAADWDRHTVAFVDRSGCRSISASIAYTQPGAAASEPVTATLVIIQRNRPLTSVNVRSGGIATLRATLHPGPFELAVENAPGTAYGDGSASCNPTQQRRARTRAAEISAHAASVASTTHQLPGYLLTPTCRRADYSCVQESGYDPRNATLAQHAQWWYTDYYSQGSPNAAGLHNCTTYAAFRLYQNGITTDPGYLGNASDWARNAASMPGVTVDQNPTVGAIAQWNGQPGEALTTSHVGYVQAVTATAIEVWSDSFDEQPKSDFGHTSVYVIPRDSAAMPDNFIHFPDPKGATASLTAAQTAGLAHVNHIVHWNGDTKAQKTAWYVSMTLVPPLASPVPMRHWIPDIQTYWCLVNQRHAPQPPDDLSASTLSNDLPDDVGSWATCDTSVHGQGSDGATTAGAVPEQAGHYGAPTFTDYHTASDAGPRIPAGAFVSVACKVLDGNVASSRPDGYWYQIVGDPWDGNYWAPANVFMNGDPWNGPYSHNTDFNIPDCGAGSGAGPAMGGSAGPTAVGTWLEQEGHHGAPTFSDYHSAGGPGPAVAAGEYVHVACKVLDGTIASANPDNHWYLLADQPWNGQYYAAANTFMNGDPWNGPYSHNTDLSVPDCGQGATTKTGTAPSPPAGETTFSEQEGHNGVHTFTDYNNASGLGPDISAGQTVQVSCKVLDGTIASSNPDGYWYRIASSPWSDGYYAPANTFMNGDPWNGPYTHNTDFAVPDCAGATPTPPPPSPAANTYAETVGGVTHTWTSYSDAGGTEGPSIQTGQTVQITCKLTGFKVADGNTWWYQIASSPWSNGYYASADAFYNNGATSGSLVGTPFVDSNVPTCGSGSTGQPPPPPPPPAQTYAETTGGVTHTWTDYSDAGGTQGPSIPSNDTVQIACRVTGFKVADGDTWWYRVASSPWSDTYYASADAFYNNGANSGTLVGTPFVDPNVANC